jgi:hypothetical protein
MKVFVRGETIIATYADDADVPPDAHGKDVNVVMLPASAVTQRPREVGSPIIDMKLAKDWREQAGRYRPASRGVTDVLQYVLDHGADPDQWPADAKRHLAEIKKTWPKAS